MSAETLPARPHQASFDELGTPLREVTFVVVDLETTGGSAQDCEITEIGAVKVRAGRVLGEFQTLVRPNAPIPPFISVLTGITDGMVASAPTVGAVLPAFLEFAKGAVLVAHNAPFDVGFLREAAGRCGLAWPTWGVLDTARLARRVLAHDDVPDCKLATLARYFRATTAPEHRALSDARATVDVLHGLIERVGTEGVASLEELSTYSSRVPAAVRRKRHLAEGLPHAPGVYLFEDGRGRVLYVGKSVDVAARVRTYFTAAETRARMAEMVRLAERVRHVPCPTTLEAEVRELRLIGEHKPPYNRRSRFPERALWLKLTVEAFPRLSIVRAVRDDGATYLGPFGSRRAAEDAMTAVHEAVPLRQCSGRLSPRRRVSPCALAEMGRCGAPCAGRETPEAYAAHVALVRSAMLADATPLVRGIERRIGLLSDAQRFEDAAAHRDRLAAFLRAAGRMHRYAGVSACAELLAARPRPDGGWELALVRHGRLAGTSVVPRAVAPLPWIDALVATGEQVGAGVGPTSAGSAEELDCVLRWLDGDGVRLVRLEGTWASPAGWDAGLLERYGGRVQSGPW
ncbi:MAG TPA: DEDD exonuclease domain-containing protein [Actinomycetes bacterium]|nr:DEDD exonuclease domain-containing protein [Actinomycetes bacterium]